MTNGSSKREGEFGEVERPRFEEYSKQFEKWFVMERRDGIIEARVRTNGGPAINEGWAPSGDLESGVVAHRKRPG